MKSTLKWILFGVILDQLSKWGANTYLSLGLEGIQIFPGLSFNLVHNYGAAYGILQNQQRFLLILNAVVILGLVIFGQKLVTSKWSKRGLAFILIGAIGNFIDRIFHGYVVDFINIQIFPVFNIADMCIDIGIGLFILEMGIDYLETRRQKQEY